MHPDFQALFAASPYPYLLVDTGCTIIGANEAYLRAAGQCLDALMGKHIFDAFPANPGDPASTNLEEVRTAILRGRLQGLAEGVFVPSEAQFASLLKHVEGLGRLIEDLRVVSLAESDRVDLQWQMSRLDVEAGNVVRLFECALLDAGLRPSLATTPGEVPCDPLRIRQALLALLENVRVHAVPGELRVGVCIPDGWARVYVEDEGPGVAESDRSEIFTAFRRAAAPGASGAGLGLAVVAAIAAAHSGRAACVAADTGGSRFELAWPIPNGGEDDGALAAVARSAQ